MLDHPNRVVLLVVQPQRVALVRVMAGEGIWVTEFLIAGWGAPCTIHPKVFGDILHVRTMIQDQVLMVVQLSMLVDIIILPVLSVQCSFTGHVITG